MPTSFIDIEKLMKKDIEGIYNKILSQHKYILPISAKSRSGAEISDFLEDCFVKILSEEPHSRVYNPKGAPKGKTKNPYDFCFNYYFKTDDLSFDDLIWGDIKATKHTYKDSNPDLGTPEKIIDFIMDGHFYLMFVLFEYEPTNDNKTRFIKFEDGKYVHCQFLKDINHTVRINPKPQFQVNISEPEEYRTKKEFIDLFQQKYSESLDRIITNALKKKAELPNRFDMLKIKINDYQKIK